ncbi:MAG: hypothetical protein VYE22_01230 [Myxococcota bacterium]|nr:hypothetical protein [Myxococcota bacterium]
MRAITLCLLLLGCAAEDVGDCDPRAALEIVYTADGVPAFAGQALVNQSCGGGSFCHAGGLPAERRFGAPVGLEFDLTVASTSGDLAAEESARLSREQLQVHRHRARILEQVAIGAMPPAGAVGESVLASVRTYDRVGADGRTFTPLPSVSSDEGRELLRNWLACGSPVVERTVAPSEGENAAGFTVPACERGCVDPTWPAIATEILAPSCAFSRCHDADDPEAGLDLSFADEPARSALHARLLEGGAQGELCVDQARGAAMIAPGDPDASLLVRKVTPDDLPCGSLMPLGGAPLSDQRLCALRAWVACGACADPDDPRCADCQREARAECGVVLDEAGAPTCADAVTCPGFARPR